jgi:trehalose 6-phosphate phosphatase
MAIPDCQALSRWRRWLATRLQNLRGWWIEDKPLGFALHYRQVPPGQVTEMTAILKNWQEQLPQEEGFQILAGKKVLDILPQGVSKGAAIGKILLLPGFVGFFPVYLGDDTSDESAFRMVQGRGMAIRVGSPGRPTAASHFLPDTTAVGHFLALLAAPPEEL